MARAAPPRLDECARMLRPGGQLILISRVSAEAGLRRVVEQTLQPIVRRLGWRTEFPWELFARWAERHSDMRLIERRAVPPFGHFSPLRFEKSEKPINFRSFIGQASESPSSLAAGAAGRAVAYRG